MSSLNLTCLRLVARAVILFSYYWTIAKRQAHSILVALFPRYTIEHSQPSVCLYDTHHLLVSKYGHQIGPHNLAQMEWPSGSGYLLEVHDPVTGIRKIGTPAALVSLYERAVSQRSDRLLLRDQDAPARPVATLTRGRPSHEHLRTLMTTVQLMAGATRQSADVTHAVNEYAGLHDVTCIDFVTVLALRGVITWKDYASACLNIVVNPEDPMLTIITSELEELKFLVHSSIFCNAS